MTERLDVEALTSHVNNEDDDRGSFRAPFVTININGNLRCFHVEYDTLNELCPVYVPIEESLPVDFAYAHEKVVFEYEARPDFKEWTFKLFMQMLEETDAIREEIEKKTEPTWRAYTQWKRRPDFSLRYFGFDEGASLSNTA